jgi:energy-coupling factor transport system ATP-binding protein
MTVSVHDLTFKYIGRLRPALSHVSFALERGEALLVLGPSGCGKSTLALCLNGAIPHFVEGVVHGNVRVGGLRTHEASMAQLAQRVGLVFQDPEAQFCMLTLEEEVAFGLENLAVPRAEMDARIDQALESVGLADRRFDQIEHLSGGQKQRLALACVLALRPEVLVLDEPTAQLDPEGAAEVIDVLHRLRAAGQLTLVIVEHRLDEVMSLVDRTLLLNQSGEMVAFGPPREVIQRWSAWLSGAGVWVPQVSELATALSERGLKVQPFPLTVADASVALRPLRWLLDRVQDTRAPGASDDAPVVLETVGLSHTYLGTVAPALRDVSIQILPRRLRVVVGANGSGKSTLAQLCAGVLRPPPDRVRLRGFDARRLDRRAIARYVGYVFQYPEHQFVGRSVLDDVAFGLRRAGVREVEATQRARATLEDFGLGALAEAHPFSLSHGEQRRLSVAAMLVLDQEILFLDEPTFGQDRGNAYLLLERLTTLARTGRGIVAITHDMRLVAERAERVIALAMGEIVFDGSPRQLFTDADVLHRARLRPPPLWRTGQELDLARPPLSVADVLAALPSAVGSR